MSVHRLVISAAVVVAAAVWGAGCGGSAVPAVVDLDEGSAVQMLKDAGLPVETRNQPSDSVEKGTVISVTPAVGADVPEGQAVELLVSSGPPYRMRDLMMGEMDVTSSVTEFSAPTVFAGAENDGAAAYAEGPCWPSGFGSRVRKTAYGMFTGDSGEGIMSVAIYDMGGASAARSALSQVDSAQSSCATGGQAAPNFAGGMMLGANWLTATTVDGYPAMVTVAVPNTATAMVTQGLRVTFAQGRYLVTASVTNMDASFASMSDPMTADPAQESLLSDVVSTEQMLIEEHGLNSEGTVGGVSPE